MKSVNSMLILIYKSVFLFEMGQVKVERVERVAGERKE
jgi:hypothetical protein